MSRPASLLDIIRLRIAQNGPMDMAEYMALCLGHPEHGYYMTRDPFGTAGDFTTAPEISQLFGEMVGIWLADLWIKFGKPESFVLLEVGPGRGTLMADIMRATKRVEGFHAAARIRLMEMSPVLRAAQRQALSAYDVRWIDGLEDVDSKMPVFLIGNEFLDALPVHQFVRQDGVWHERVIGLDAENALTLGLKIADDALIEELPISIRHANQNGVFEFSRMLNQFVKRACELWVKQSGAALFLDYGHVASGFGDTLQAVKSHRFISIFDTPGSCDLTAHVDFETVVRIARTAKITPTGPVTQAAFLKNLGIEMRAARLIEAVQKNAACKSVENEPRIATIKSGLNRLIDTEQMGTLFKVLALCHDPAIIPAGFHEGL